MRLRLKLPSSNSGLFNIDIFQTFKKVHGFNISHQSSSLPYIRFFYKYITASMFHNCNRPIKVSIIAVQTAASSKFTR